MGELWRTKLRAIMIGNQDRNVILRKSAGRFLINVARNSLLCSHRDAQHLVSQLNFSSAIHAPVATETFLDRKNGDAIRSRWQCEKNTYR
jgi:hypothetical protein